MAFFSRKSKRRIAIRPVAVAPKTALHWRALVTVLAVAAGVLLGLWVNQRLSGGTSDVPADWAQERRGLQEHAARLEQEVARLTAAAASNDSRLQVEKSTQGQLAKQIKAVEEENARLKEELAFFENLLPGDGKDGRLAIHRFRVEPNGVPGEYRYRLVVVAGIGRESREFHGSLQLIVNIQRGDRNTVVTLPDARSAGDPSYKLRFKRVQRVEGMFRVEPTATVRTVQVRVLENGHSQPRATESFSLT